MPDPSKLRIGVVGLGKMGLLHTAILNSLPHSSVVAVAEPQAFLREGFGRLQSSIGLFPSLETLLEEARPDAVVVTTPVAHHVPAALECLRKEIPFFLEKPLAISCDQARELIEQLRKKPTLNMVGFMMRFSETFRKAREILQSGCLGKLHRVQGSMYASQLFTQGTGWRYERSKSGGGVLSSQGCHLLDLMTWMFGRVRRVNAQTFSPYSRTVEDTAHLMLEFESGLQGQADSSWSVRFRRVVETTIEIWAEQGALTVTDDTVSLFLDQASGEWPAGRTVLRATDLFEPVPVDIGGPVYTREDQAFIQAVRKGQPVTPDVAEAFHVQQIMDAAYASAEDRSSPREIIS